MNYVCISIAASAYEQRGNAQFDASRPGKRYLESSRDENKGAYRSGEWEGESLLSDPGSELGLGREKGKENVRRY